MNNTLLVNLNAVKSANSNFFVELTQGYYKDETEETTFWAENSLYVYGDIWTSCLDGLATDFVTDYNFFEFTDVNEPDNQNFCQALINLADKLDKVTEPNNLQSDDFLSKKQEPYIRFDNSLHDIISETPNQTKIEFNKNFAVNIQKIVNTYRELASWLTENRHVGVSNLGI